MSRLSNEQFFNNIYHDLEQRFGSAKSLYEQAKDEGAVITFEEVKNFMKKLPNKQKDIRIITVIYHHLLGNNFKQTFWT